MDLLASLTALAPLMNVMVVILVAVGGFVTRSVGKKLDAMALRIEQLNVAVNAQITTTAVVQTQLQAHTEQDRNSFHEIRGDMSTRFSQQQVQIENCRASLENLRLATMQRAQ